MKKNMTSEPGLVYLLTPEGVYDHGCLGVFRTREEAEVVANYMMERSDGYHNLRIDEMMVGVPLNKRASNVLWYGRLPKLDTGRVVFSSWKDIRALGVNNLPVNVPEE